MGTFSCAQIDVRKARELELATLDENSTSSGIAEPYARQKMKARTRGGEGTTPVTTACPEVGKQMCVKKKKIHGARTDSRLNAFITGNPLWGKLLGTSIGRVLGL